MRRGVRCRAQRPLCSQVQEQPTVILSQAAGSALLERSRPHLFASAVVAPGTRIRVDTPGKTRVSVHTGPPGLFAVSAEPPVGSGASPLDWRPIAGGWAVTSAGVSALQQLRVWVPERFHSVSVTTGGCVSVDRITEGDVDVNLTAADAHALLGNLKCGNIHLRTQGGNITASLLSGEALGLHSAGGMLKCERVVGRRVALVTADGEMEVNVALVHRIRAVGRHIRMNTLRVSAHARLLSPASGDIHLRAVDGEPDAALHVHSGGGALDVGLEAPAETFGAMHLSSGGGRIMLAVPAEWSAPVRCVSGVVDGSRVANHNLAIPHDPAAFRSRKAAAARHQGASHMVHAPAAAQAAGIAVDAGHGAVTLRLRSWLDMALGQDRASKLRIDSP